jgi:anti-sigma factor ChrR (cupin superfamily)
MTIADFEALTLENLSPVQVGPGCLRWDLPATAGVRAWIVDIEPGAQWPHVDQHDEHGEQVWVISGEMIEGEQKFAAGTYLNFGPNSRHQPRSETGVRLFGINLTPKAD